MSERVFAEIALRGGSHIPPHQPIAADCEAAAIPLAWLLLLPNFRRKRFDARSIFYCDDDDDSKKF